MSNRKSELDRLDEFDFDDSFDDDDYAEIETYDSDSKMKMFSIDEMMKSAEAKNDGQDDDKILDKENVEYVTEHSPSEDTVKAEKKLIDGVEVIVKAAVEKAQSAVKPREHIRKYSKKETKENIVFRKPKETGGFLKKLILFLCACVAVGIFLGVQANSYYIFKDGKVDSNFTCVYGWLLEDNMPFALSSLNADVFGVGFLTGFCILAVIGLLIYLDNDAKKHSRVGYEHGKARLATPKDFKNFKNRFME